MVATIVLLFCLADRPASRRTVLIAEQSVMSSAGILHEPSAAPWAAGLETEQGPVVWGDVIPPDDC
jgi:hypothetical protein